jgi:hypothetical protein
VVPPRLPQAARQDALPLREYHKRDDEHLSLSVSVRPLRTGKGSDLFVHCHRPNRPGHREGKSNAAWHWAERFLAERGLRSAKSSKALWRPKALKDQEIEYWYDHEEQDGTLTHTVARLPSKDFPIARGLR